MGSDPGGEDEEMSEVTGPDEAVEALLHEQRQFRPSKEFSDQANATTKTYEDAASDPEAWWAEQARTLEWDTPFMGHSTHR